MNSAPSDPHPNEQASTSGKLVVGCIVVVAGLVAVFTVIYHWQRGRSSIVYWGAANGESIRYAPKVTVEKDGKSVDISKVPGIVHFRQALIEDASFEGTKPGAKVNLTWTYIVRFSWPDSDRVTVVQIDAEKGLLGLEDKEEVLIAKPEPTASGIRQFLSEVTSANPEP